jgi:flagellar hook-associated protein 1 FlgK
MPGLNGSLFSATQALAAHSKALEIAGKNLANINNPAYARQRVILADRGSIRVDNQKLGMGVEARGVQQIRDRLLDRRVVREISMTSGLTASQDVLQAAQIALGQQLKSAGDSSSVSDISQSSSSGVADALSDFFAAFDSLAASPQDTGQRQLLLQKAGILTERINTTDARLTQVQSDVDAQTADDVVSANDLLGEIAHLNELIGVAENGNPASALDLRDQRQAKLEKLSEYFNFDAQEIPGSNGQLEITVKDASGADVVLVDRNVVAGSIGFDGVNFTGGAAASVLGFKFGSLQARVDARDGAVLAARDGLAALAGQLTSAVNAAYNPTGLTGDFFSGSPSGLIGLQAGLTAASLKTTDTANAGANELALAVATVANTKFHTTSGDLIDGTPSGFLSSIVSGLGQSLASASARLDDQQLSQQAVAAMRDAVSGVSQDEELTDLMQYQRSFQASARYLNVVDSLLELVVTRLGIS